MTLYDLTNATTVQGNIEIKIFDSNREEKESRFFLDQDDFCTRYTDCEDIEDYEITFLYPRKSYDGTMWLVIELSEE